jgi:hypothetical protein
MLIVQGHYSLPIEKTHALLNSGPTLLRKSDGELDHVGRLGIAELGVVTLVGIDLQDVDRHVDSLLANLLGHLANRYSGHDGDTVLLLEVLGDGNLLGSIIWIGEGGLGCILVDEFFDSPGVQS